MKIMDKTEMQALSNKLAHIAGEITALCALTEIVKDAASKEDDPYAQCRLVKRPQSKKPKLSLD